MKKKDTASSWIIVAAVTLILSLEQGLVKSFSVLLPDFKEQFSTLTWVVGWSVSFLFGWGCILGLASNTLVSMSVGRPSLIVCGITASVGLLICSSAQNALTLLLGLTFVGAVLLQTNIAMGAVPHYFDTYFETAVSIYSCGTGIGITVMPLITQLLRDIYGWRGALMLLSGVYAHTIAFGAFVKIDSKNEHDEHSADDTRCLISSAAEKSPDKTESLKGNSSFITTLSTLVDLSLLTDFHFITEVMVPSFVIGYTYAGWLIYTVSYAISNGVSLKEATIVATSGGVALTAIRIVLPIFHKILNYRHLMYIGSFISAISLFLTTQVVSFLGMCFMSAFYGLSYGILGAEIMITVPNVTDNSRYYSGVAWCMLFEGAGTLASGFFTGWLFDMTGSFAASFTILAVISLLTAASFGLGDLVVRIKRNHASI